MELATEVGDGVGAAGQVKFMLGRSAPKPVRRRSRTMRRFQTDWFDAAAFGCAALFGQGQGLVWLITVQPFTHRIARAAKLTSGGFEAVMPGRGD